MLWAESATTSIILTTTSKKNLLKGPGDNTIKHVHTILRVYSESVKQDLDTKHMYSISGHTDHN